MPNKKKFSFYVYKEVWTAIGQLVEVSCRPDEIEAVKDFVSSHIRTVHIPTTKHINVCHGGYGRLSRFDIQQHEYAGGGGGYVEVLEIKNAPDGRCGIVVHEYIRGRGSTFFEFASVEEAKNSWDLRLSRSKDIKQADGFIRAVRCGGLEPWFYALADQTLMGDFVFPDVVEEDSVYRLGRKFILHEEGKFPQIKTCMGIENREAETSFPTGIKKYKVIFWDDGTVIDEWHGAFSGEIIPLDEAAPWIKETLDKFHEILTGKEKRGTINFANGDKIFIRLQRQGKNQSHPSGKYFAKVELDSGVVKEGTFEFSPTPEMPTLESFLVGRGLADSAISKVLMVKKLSKSGHFPKKLWEGFFHSK